MSNALPLVPISQKRLNYLVATLLVYQQYRLRQTPPSEERRETLLVLTFLILKLQRGIEPHKGDLPLLLTVDEVCVMKSGFAMLIDCLNRRPVSYNITKEIAQLKELKTMLDQSFSTTQD
jgi:hypothetical protein